MTSRSRLGLVAAGTAVLVGAGIVGATATSPAHHAKPKPSPTASADGWPRPDDRKTPGAVDPALTADYLCHTTTDDRRKTTQAVKDAVYRAYGLPPSSAPEYVSGSYEIDHRVPLWAGGRDVPQNLWPEWNNHPQGALNTKDVLERKLYADVCHTHTVSLADAQRAFLGDWVLAYNRYVGPLR